MTEEHENETAVRLRRAVTRMNRRLRQSALGGITPAQASMLGSINVLGAPSLGDLALREQVQPPSVTRIVKHLEEMGLITLRLDADDRRCTRAELTTAGHRELSHIRRRKTQFLESRLSALTPADQTRASELVDLLESLLDEE
jgi:DNA-binding MarR family transcriptional regulator